jgi:hypothetical protein
VAGGGTRAAAGDAGRLLAHSDGPHFHRSDYKAAKPVAKASYVDTFMDVIRWNNVERLLVQTTRGTAGDARQ